MTPKQRNTAIVITAIVLLAGAGIAGAAYYTGKNDATPVAQTTTTTTHVKTAHRDINWDKPAPVQAAPVQQVSCNDGNIVGMVTGGALGGVAGSQIGKGNGKTAATIGGAVGGAYLGKQYIPTQNVTCR